MKALLLLMILLQLFITCSYNDHQEQNVNDAHAGFFALNFYSAKSKSQKYIKKIEKAFPQ